MRLAKPMLAAKPEPEELDVVLAALAYPAYYSPKLDGIRATVQNGKLYSRALKLIPNKAMQALWGHPEFEGLDGEIIVGPPTAENCFNRSTSTVMSRDKSAESAVFNVFDMLDELEPFSIRSANVHYRVNELRGMQCIAVPHEVIRTYAGALKYEERMTKRGHEGVMRRSTLGGYKHGRSTLKEGGLIAIKRFVDAEAVILNTYEQEENTNAQVLSELGRMKRSSHKAGKVGKGTLGGFTVTLITDARCSFNLANVPLEKQFNIGSGVGLTDAVRAELWQRRKSLVGKIIKLRYQKVGTMEKPRIPIFLGFRDPKDL